MLEEEDLQFVKSAAEGFNWKHAIPNADDMIHSQALIMGANLRSVHRTISHPVHRLRTQGGVAGMDNGDFIRSHYLLP